MNQKPQILYVDDEDYMLDCMSATFEIAELSISTAENAKAALELLLHNSSFKIVISDYRMPNMNGVDFLSIVAEKYPHTIRILCSAYIDDNDLTTYLANGTINHFIRKPWDINALISLVAKELETSSFNPENEYVPKFMPMVDCPA